VSECNSGCYCDVHLMHDQITSNLHGVLAHHPGEEVLSTKVRCHDDHGVPKVHRPVHVRTRVHLITQLKYNI
jgi:hypothetical protein